MKKWKEFFPYTELMQTPCFEAEARCYPKLKIVCEYMSWRQAECKLYTPEFICSFELV
jgi:tRNA(His) guanylyltransferase